MDDRIRSMLDRWRSWIKETDELVQEHETGVIKENDEVVATMKDAADRLRKLAEAVEKKHDA